MRLVTVCVSLGFAATFGGCGVAKAPLEPAAKAVELKVTPAKLSSTQQHAGDEVTLSMTVTNTGSNPAPDVLVQLKGLETSTKDDPLNDDRTRTTKTDLPDSTKRAPWFVDDSPQHSSLSASDLYPAGTLEPGRTRTLKFTLLAQSPGDHTIEYQVFAGLTDNQAKKLTGTGLTGSVSAHISEH